jgi:translation initiation factor IF-1
MTLNTNKILTSAALALMVGFGVAESAKAESAQLMSQVPTPAESNAESDMDASSLTEIKATVIRVTNENAVRVRLENGGYKMVSLVRSNRLGSLSRGDTIFITMRGDEVIGVSSEAGAYQQVATTTRSTTTRIESSQSSQETAPTVQTETVQPRPVPQAQQPAPAPAPTPEPAARPAPQPVRALW